MEPTAWTKRLRALYDKALSLYQRAHHDLDSYFTAEEQKTLAAIGLKPINVYDAVEDFTGGGDPDWDTFLLMAAARRDYFLYVQKGQSATHEVQTEDLPARKAELGGFPWLPRIIVKARCFLEGSLCRDIMYDCGGDRHFLAEHNIHPADFLREVWAAHGSDEKILKFVQDASAR